MEYTSHFEKDQEIERLQQENQSLQETIQKIRGNVEQVLDEAYIKQEFIEEMGLKESYKEYQYEKWKEQQADSYEIYVKKIIKK